MEDLFNKLTDIFKNSTNVILMGHSCPDLDALGSCLGLSSILDSMNIDNNIFLNTDKVDNYAVRQAVNVSNYKRFIDETNYKDKLDKNTYLVIVDTHISERVEYQQILSEVDKIIVIDHHIKMNNYINNTELLYIDSSLSSVVELVAFYANYIGVNINSVISSIMLGGMEIDTNGFNIKVSEQSFLAASILVSMGADMIVKQKLLKETITSYLKKADYIKSSYIFHKNIALCLLDAPESKVEELAEISESLLGFENIEASFTIGQLDSKTVGISARSIGNIDVCEIMNLFGGGGHTTIAACQVNDTTVKDLEKKLKKVLTDKKL